MFIKHDEVLDALHTEKNTIISLLDKVIKYDYVPPKVPFQIYYKVLSRLPVP